MSNKFSIWHITPVDIGVRFANPSSSSIETNNEFYDFIHNKPDYSQLKLYSKRDKEKVLFMWDYFSKLEQLISSNDEYIGAPVTLQKNYPPISGCIAKYLIGENLSCYILLSGVAVFLEIGEEFAITNESYFSLEAFYQRQIYEDDYCKNPNETPRKKVVYRFTEFLRSATSKYDRHFSSSKNYGCNGIPYTLCMTVIDIPLFDVSKCDQTLQKNLFSLLDTSAFNNILDKSQWELIKKRIDSDQINMDNYKKLSESLLIGDSWSGVVIVGDIKKNNTSISWLLEFELYLQAQWVLFDSYNECISREDYSSLEIQSIINNVEFIKIQLDNDISTNMEQSRMNMRKSLIITSDIGVIYSKMKAALDNRLKLQTLLDEKKKNKFSLMSDVSLLIIALMQIYSVINELLFKEMTRNDYITVGILIVIALVCSFILVKGKK